LFVQVVRLVRECGLVKLGTVAVDGTKLRLNGLSPVGHQLRNTA
jgi:hypothetical protein